MQAPPYCCGLRGKDLTACFAPLAGCLLRRPLCLRSSLRTARTARCPKCHRRFGLTARAFSGSSPSRSYSNEKNSTFSVLLSFVWLRGKDLTACFAPLAGCLLRRPLCLRSSLRAARTARYPKCHRHFGLPLAPSQVQVLIS